MAVLHRLHARPRRPGAGALARRAYGCLWLSPRLARGHASSRRLESGSFFIYDLRRGVHTGPYYIDIFIVIFFDSREAHF